MIPNPKDEQKEGGDWCFTIMIDRREEETFNFREVMMLQ